jgi:hypothetical protein
MVLLHKVLAAVVPTRYWRAPWYDRLGPGSGNNEDLQWADTMMGERIETGYS